MMLLTAGVGEDFWESLVLQGDHQSILKEISPEWVFIGRTDAEAETPIVWPPDVKNWLIGKIPWERLKAGGEGGNRGWDGWMASPTQWIWVWVNSGSLWWTGKPGVLQSMGSQRVRHNWATELNWITERTFSKFRDWQQVPHPLHAFWDNIGTRRVVPGHNMIDMNLAERQFAKQIQSH